MTYAFELIDLLSQLENGKGPISKCGVDSFALNNIDEPKYIPVRKYLLHIISRSGV
jgi:hypothetical protein